jgi:hypothetical protein
VTSSVGAARHENEVGAFGDGDDLAAAALALGRALDDTRQIQQLREKKRASEGWQSVSAHAHSAAQTWIFASR